MPIDDQEIFIRSLLNQFVIFSILLFAGCKGPEVEIPEYQKYDWYVNYTIDNTETTIVKNGYDNTYLPAVTALDGYAYSINPDSSETILLIDLEAGFTSDQFGIDSIIGFDLSFNITEQELLNARELSYDERLDMLQNFMNSKVFANIPGNLTKDAYATISIIDKDGHIYRNFQNSGVISLIEYVIKVKSTGKVPHPDYGKVLQIELDIESELMDTQYPGVSYTLFAEVRAYLIPPFSN